MGQISPIGNTGHRVSCICELGLQERELVKKTGFDPPTNIAKPRLRSKPILRRAIHSIKAEFAG
jgi:hypothetical protein